MSTIIIYDVPSKHKELKEALFKLGYKDEIPDTSRACRNGIIYCPNTTLYHPTKDPSSARDEVKIECQKLKISLDRCVSTQWGPNWSAVCGGPFK